MARPPRWEAHGPLTFHETTANEVVLTVRQLKVDPELSHRKHHFQYTDLSGGTVDLDVLGPAGVWATVQTGKTEGQITEFNEPYPAFRFRFVGGGGAGKVTVVSYAVDEALGMHG